MIIYNITIKADWLVHDEWLQWMKRIFIPGVLNCGCFIKHRFVHLLETDDADGLTYAVQFYAETIDDYKRFVHSCLPALAKNEKALWGDRIITFATVMQTVE